MGEVATLEERFASLIQADGERARRELEAEVRLNPQSAEAFGLLAAAHLRCLDFGAAAAAYRAVLALAPEDGVALNGLAFCLMKTDDLEVALAAAERAFAITRSVQSANYMALIQHARGRLAEAVQGWRHVLAAEGLSPENRIFALRRQMLALRDAGLLHDADDYAGQVLEIFRRLPLMVASILEDREQSTAFPEWYKVADKAELASLLRRGLVAEPGGRVPETFVLPQDRAALAAYALEQPGAVYIAKPRRGSGGRGIRLAADVGSLLGARDTVVQRYIDRPYLVDGRKSHLRIYAFVTSVDPPRAYIWEEGVVRFAPGAYGLSPEALTDTSRHITNTALHEGHPDLVVSADPACEDEGAIWSLTALLRRIRAETGREPQAVFGQIRDLVAWTVRAIARDGLLARQAAFGPRRAFGPKLLGFDILLDAEVRPWLIELQGLPARGGAPLVERINSELFVQMFRMTVGRLLNDGWPEAAAIGGDPEAIAAHELAIEVTNLGRFSPLDLG